MKSKNKSIQTSVEIPPGKAQTGHSAMEKLAGLNPEHARAQFRTLLLANPNFFGNLKESPFKPVIPIATNTAYEELGCVGYHPQLKRLEAVVYVKQSSGYNGGICTSGSQEYVRFYLSTDGGATWHDQGMSSFTAYDVQGQSRLEYAVTREMDPAKLLCVIENLPKVRAILSWNNPPPANTPGFIPVWGNVVEVTIQVEPASLLVLGKLFELAKVKLPDTFKTVFDLDQEISAVKPKALSGLELHELYEGSHVPGHRYLFAEMKSLAVNPAVTQTNLADVLTTPLAKLNINLAAIIGALFNTDGDTSFEQLDCIGYDPNREALAGVLTVKKSSGFSGGLCTAGSQEYVAFWIDWNDGSGWIYAGTASVNTHDLKAIPGAGLKYSVFLPVDVAAHRQACAKGPRMAQVRAILSWQSAPPPGNPNYQPTWGNRLETRILLKPGVTVEPGMPDIAIIGGIGVADINIFGDGMTKPGALFALTGDAADPWLHTRECPFGGLVALQGYPSVGDKYRIRVRNAVTSTEFVVMDNIRTVDLFGVGTVRTPDVNGYLPYLDPSQNIDNVLGWWHSSGDDLWQVRLEILRSGGTTGATAWYNVQLDNTAPAADIHIDSGGDCKDFTQAVTVNGHFVARDLNFGAYSLSVAPFGTPPGTLTPTSGTVQTALPPGDAWLLDTTGMQPCGYVVYLSVADRAIVGSSPYGHNWGSATVGFCLRANKG
jgi:hypothetical protein